MFENLGKLYAHYGGVGAIVRSSYFWVSMLFAVISLSAVDNSEWADRALSVMPSLAGFTIASFAIIFAILDPEMLRKLLVPDSGGSSPITRIAASIGHAVFIQVSAMVFAIAFKLSDLNPLFLKLDLLLRCSGSSGTFFRDVAGWISVIFSSLGLFLTYYGVMLVLAAILSIVRVQLIIADASRKRTSTHLFAAEDRSGGDGGDKKR